MSSGPRIVLDAVLRTLAPLVRMLVRNGVTYPAFTTAVKRVFLDAARVELAAKGMAPTDSAVTLLSGVHRRDVRNLKRQPRAPQEDLSEQPLGLAAEVVARWMSEHVEHDAAPPHGLTRTDFDALVQSVSSDVRPRAVLDELLRLGVATEDEAGVTLLADGFAPRKGLAETARLFADNLGDHAAAAALNLQGQANFLEQAVFVDEIGADSARRLQEVAVRAWRQAFRQVMREAQERFDADASRPPDERGHRARFGVYFFSDREGGQ